MHICPNSVLRKGSSNMATNKLLEEGNANTSTNVTPSRALLPSQKVTKAIIKFYFGISDRLFLCANANVNDIDQEMCLLFANVRKV